MSQLPSPDPVWKGLPPLLGLALLVIGPPVGILAFAHGVTQNPVVLAIIIFSYEVLLFIGAFITKIWQQLENPLVEQITAWISLRTQEMTSGYEQKYRQHLVYEHQVFDVKGLSTQTAHALELEHVFVELNIDPKAPHQASPDLLPVPKHLRHGEHSIWDYLSSSNSLANPHFVILGTPGSGKSTLLKHITLILAQHKQQHYHIHLAQTFPILLFLRDHVSSVKELPNFSLADAVHDHIQKKWQRNVPAQWIERHLEWGKCLVLLDGLDEVADVAMRQQMVAWVQRQMVAYGNNRFVLTSRPYGYRDNPLDNVTVLEVYPFTPDQIEHFVQNWYLANELKSWGKEDPGVHMRAREGAEDFLHRLHRTPALLALAINPLLLTMIATVHRYRSSLPGKRVALYAEICEVFLGKRQEARGIDQELSPAQKQQVLQPLAYHLMKQGMREISRQEAQQVIAPHLVQVNTQMLPATFLQLVENTSGLLLERNVDSYGFAHKTFQEYLAAVYIKEQGQEQVLIAQVESDWWHETIRLYCAQADATAIILACLAGDRPSLSALTLALACDEEKLKIQPKAQAQLDTLLTTSIEDPEPERRRLIAEVLLTRRAQQMIHMHGETYIDTTLITWAEYQLFLDEERAKGVSHLPDHWLSDTFLKGQGQSPALGVQSSDAVAFCQWLTARDPEGWQYRLPKKSEPYQLGAHQDRLPQLTVDIGYWTDDGEGFAWIRNPRPQLEHIRNELGDVLVSDHVWASAFTLVLDLADISNRIHVLDGIYDADLARTGASTKAFVSDLTRALDADLARTGASAKAFVSDLTRALARGRDPVSTLAHARDLARVIADDLANDLARAFAQAERSLDFISPMAVYMHRVPRSSPRDLARDLIHDLLSTLDRALDRALTSTIALTRTLDRDRTITIDRTSTLALALNLARSCDLLGTFAFDLDPAFDLARALDLPGTLARARDLALVRASTLLDTFAFDLARTLTATLDHTFGRDTTPSSHEQILYSLWSIRYSASVLIHYYLSLYTTIPSSQGLRGQLLGRKGLLNENLLPDLIESWSDLHATLALLELRIRGRLAAWEGILLVKERVTEQVSSAHSRMQSRKDRAFPL